MKIKKATLISSLLSMAISASCRQSTQNYMTESAEDIVFNIKKVTQVEYEYKSGKPDLENGFIKKIEVYDRDGSLVKETSSHKSEYLKEYDEIDIFYYSDYEYTDSMVIYTPDNDVKSKMVYTHDENTVTLCHYLNTGTLDYKIEYEYNENEQPISSYKHYTADGALKRESIEQYDDIGLKSYLVLQEGIVIEEKTRVNNDKHIFKFETRDENGNLKEILTEKYDEDDNLVEYHFISYNENEVEYVFHMKHSYFENGLSKESISFNEKGDPEELIIYYYEPW